MILIYLLLAFLATLFGSMAGLGGGVIIKPVLDVIGLDSIRTISVLSSATVFSMAVVSTFQQLISGFRFERRMIFLAAGAVFGGITGQQLFAVISDGMNQENLKGLQSVMLALLLLIVLFRKKLPDWEVRNPAVSLLVGILLGAVAAFLGIGGGPINVAVLCMVLAMTVRDAAVVSILIILFSQASKLILIGLGTGFSVYPDLHKLYYMIPGGVAGGLLGAILNRKLSEKLLDRLFTVMITGTIGLNIYNAFNAFL